MKKKPLIKTTSLQVFYQYTFDRERVIAIDVNLCVKVENVPASGEVKYQMVKDIEEAIRSVKEKYDN